METGIIKDVSRAETLPVKPHLPSWCQFLLQTLKPLLVLLFSLSSFYIPLVSGTNRRQNHHKVFIFNIPLWRSSHCKWFSQSPGFNPFNLPWFQLQKSHQFHEISPFWGFCWTYLCSLLQVRGGSAGVIESIVGVLKPITIVYVFLSCSINLFTFCLDFVNFLVYALINVFVKMISFLGWKMMIRFSLLFHKIVHFGFVFII